ncbi:MAG: hypothetical protein AAF439_09495 [Pseudomonadota bacterium]
MSFLSDHWLHLLYLAICFGLGLHKDSRLIAKTVVWILVGLAIWAVFGGASLVVLIFADGIESGWLGWLAFGPVLFIFGQLARTFDFSKIRSHWAMNVVGDGK